MTARPQTGTAVELQLPSATAPARKSATAYREDAKAQGRTRLGLAVQRSAIRDLPIGFENSKCKSSSEKEQDDTVRTEKLCVS